MRSFSFAPRPEGAGWHAGEERMDSGSAGQELAQIETGGLRVQEKLVCIKYIAVFIRILFFEHRLPDEGGLREEQAGCSGVAGLSGGLHPCLLGDICADTLMDSHILNGQVMIVLIVRIKMAQLSFVQRDKTEEAVPLPTDQRTGQAAGRPERDGDCAGTFEDQLQDWYGRRAAGSRRRGHMSCILPDDLLALQRKVPGQHIRVA